MFHEFTHCLHHVDGVNFKIKMYDIWDNEEERRTISRYITPNVCDPIVIHLYDFIVNGKPYISKIGHCGYLSNNVRKDERNRTKISKYWSKSDPV
jgi:hypothetical protein